jgi:hypothetical protein
MTWKKIHPPSLVITLDLAEDPAILARLCELADQARCPSCQHEKDIHDTDGRCWFTVEQGVPDRDLVCPCKIRKSDT